MENRSMALQNVLEEFYEVVGQQLKYFNIDPDIDMDRGSGDLFPQTGIYHRGSELLAKETWECPDNGYFWDEGEIDPDAEYLEYVQTYHGIGDSEDVQKAAAWLDDRFNDLLYNSRMHRYWAGTSATACDFEEGDGKAELTINMYFLALAED